MVKRIIDTKFWEDSTVIDKYTPEDKYFMLYLLTNPKTTSIGIYSLPKKICAFDLGYSFDTVIFLLERFENVYGNIKYNPDEQEIAVLNTLKYTISKGGKPVEDMVIRELKAVKTTSFLVEVYQNMLEWWKISNRDIDNVIKELFETEIKKRDSLHLINANANANANANTDSGNESCDESSKLNESEILKEDFEEIWKKYPNKQGKQKALKSYKKAIKDGVDKEKISKGIDDFIEYCNQNKWYTPAHGSSWFNQRRWEDDYNLNKPQVFTNSNDAPDGEITPEMEAAYYELMKERGEVDD